MDIKFEELQARARATLKGNIDRDFAEIERLVRSANLIAKGYKFRLEMYAVDEPPPADVICTIDLTRAPLLRELLGITRNPADKG